MPLQTISEGLGRPDGRRPSFAPFPKSAIKRSGFRPAWTPEAFVPYNAGLMPLSRRTVVVEPLVELPDDETLARMTEWVFKRFRLDYSGNPGKLEHYVFRFADKQGRVWGLAAATLLFDQWWVTTPRPAGLTEKETRKRFAAANGMVACLERAHVNARLLRELA